MKRTRLFLLTASYCTLAGCASLPGPLPPADGYAILPNCVVWCHAIVTTAQAQSEIESDGTAPVTSGSQTIDLDSSLSSTKQSSIDPTH
jgi:hypothetical protein